MFITASLWCGIPNAREILTTLRLCVRPVTVGIIE